MRKVLIVFLKDTFYSSGGGSGAAQWNYNHDDAGEIRVKLLGSGSLRVLRLDPVDGIPQSHLDGERGVEVAFFPDGGWSGYCWEVIDTGAVQRSRAQAAGIAVP